jgi:ribosomal protein S18 acetylase RimI-like enzyme
MADQTDPAQAPKLAEVRRFEAAGFRAWPAASASYDGTWLVRLTAGHPAKRLNSVNPLDPGDVGDFAARIARARRRFDAYGRPITFRLSPLSGPTLSSHLDGEGWSIFDPSLVMRLDLSAAPLEAASDRIPLKDIGRFTAAAMSVHGLEPGARAGLAEVIGAIQPKTGMFVLEEEGAPVATLICVHDGDLAGLFEVATEASARGRGHGRAIVLSALKWAKLRGARTAWLQVEEGNAAASNLYESMGFRTAYAYHYRRPPEA